MRTRKMSAGRRIILILTLFCLAAALFFLIEYLRFEAPREEPLLEGGDALTIEAPPDELVETEDFAEDDLPYDRLFITVERQRYATGDLRLVIPRISFDRDLQAGTTPNDLERGPGLYDYAQLPGEGNRNVSIAGHRYKRDFYYIDTVTTRDYIYLVDAENIYRYLHEASFVIEPDDWGPIYSQGFSCVTLTTCTPIGISDHRLVVRGELDAILPYSESFIFEMSGPEKFEWDKIIENFTQYWLNLHEARNDV